MKEITLDRAISSSLATPAVRMLLLTGWAWFEDGQLLAASEATPILAVVNTIYESWTKKASRGMSPFLPRSPEKEGWRWQGRSVSAGYMVADPGLCDKLTVSDWHTDVTAENACKRVVAAVWPQSEDETKLAPIFDELKEEAKELVTKRNSPGLED